MERTYINEAQKAIGGTVKVQGFIENLRNSKYMAFIVLKDITGKLQITVEKADHPELVDTIDQLTPDSVITVTGKVMENDYVKMGGVEMIPESIEIAKVIESFGVDGIVLSGGFVSKAPMAVMRGLIPIYTMSYYSPLWLRYFIRWCGPFMIKQFPFEECYFLEDAKKFRAALKGPLI